MVHRGFTYFLVWLIQSPDTPPGSCSKIPSQQWRSVQWNKVHKRPYLPQLVKQDPKVWCNSLPQDSVCSQNKLNLTWLYCMYILFYGIYLSCLPTDSVREAGGDPCLSNASPVCYTHKYTLFAFYAAVLLDLFAACPCTAHKIPVTSLLLSMSVSGSLS